jgi:uncharacterized protein (TIGR04141 family)
MEALELDTERDLVTSMAGSVADPDLGRRIEGRDSVRLTAQLDASDLASACARLLHASQQTTYRKYYPWIDNIEEITDPCHGGSCN